jgi:hypothetical protein
MAQQKIDITISEDGSVEYKVSGVKGKGCRALTKAIDDLAKVEETKDTAEARELETERERVGQKR